MSSIEFERGELVSVKNADSTLRKGYYFIWDFVKDGDAEWVIINIDPFAKTSFDNFVLEDECQQLNLFFELKYIKVKRYQLLKAIFPEYSKWFFDEIKLLIQERNDFTDTGAWLFYHYICQIEDSKFINEFLMPYIEKDIYSNKYSILLPEDETECDNKTIAEFQKYFNECKKLLFRINWKLLFEIKNLINVFDIAKKLKTTDGRSQFQRIKEDTAHFKTSYMYINRSSDFVKGTYSPRNTTIDNPIIFELNKSYIESIKPAGEKFQLMLNEYNKWLEEHKPILEFFQEIDLKRLSIEFDDSEIKKTIKLIFAGLEESIPVKKIVNGKISNDYRLALLIPVFKYILPEIFHDSNSKKDNVRKIKDFLSGKIW
jgi:hypothetical protein